MHCVQDAQWSFSSTGKYIKYLRPALVFTFTYTFFSCVDSQMNEMATKNDYGKEAGHIRTGFQHWNETKRCVDGSPIIRLYMYVCCVLYPHYRWDNAIIDYFSIEQFLSSEHMRKWLYALRMVFECHSVFTKNTNKNNPTCCHMALFCVLKWKKGHQSHVCWVKLWTSVFLWSVKCGSYEKGPWMCLHSHSIYAQSHS